jgi:hypothetical protein
MDHYNGTRVKWLSSSRKLPDIPILGEAGPIRAEEKNKDHEAHKNERENGKDGLPTHRGRGTMLTTVR